MRRKVPWVQATCPCGTTFEVPPNRIRAGRGKYCCRAHSHLYRERYTLHKVNPGWFKKGHGPQGGALRKRTLAGG